MSLLKKLMGSSQKESSTQLLDEVKELQENSKEILENLPEKPQTETTKKVKLYYVVGCGCGSKTRREIIRELDINSEYEDGDTTFVIFDDDIIL